MDFVTKLANARKRNNSLLCIGLDPDPSLMPQGVSVTEFNRSIIESTSDLVCAYKPNLAFYEVAGRDGFLALETTLKYIPSHIPVIGDGKRGDIGNTARVYAKAIFETLGFDATTVNPYLGYDSIEPFLQYGDRGVFILCRTSNPGAADLQDLKVQDGQPLYEVVARRALEWNRHGNIGLVVGATFPEQLRRIRQLCPDIPLLIPGIGTQGGDLALTARYGVDSNTTRTIINVSRQVIYASSAGDFATAARKVAMDLRDRINLLLNSPH